jgi:IMP dehydrogenase/GMP reductase
MLKFEESLSFDDVLLKPQYSEVESRSQVDVSVKLPKGFKVSHPIVPANMSAITGYDMAEAMFKMKSLALIHRFMPIEDQFDLIETLLRRNIKKVANPLDYVGVSIGVKEEDKSNLDKFIKLGVKIVCIDVAHGHSKLAGDMTRYVAETYPDVLLIAGNVATGYGAKFLWESGADIVKVGVGSGCFAAGTRILMSNGQYKNIEDVLVGDYVINKNGKPVKVLNSFSTGIKKVAELKNNSFYKNTFVTPEHEFYVGDLSSTSKASLGAHGYKKLLDVRSKTIPKKSKYKWKSVCESEKTVFLFPNKIDFEMPETFKISLKKRFHMPKFETSNHSYQEDSVIIPNYESGYLFGTFLGDGCAHSVLYKKNNSRIGAVTWYFGKNEMDVVDKLINCIEKIFNKKPKIIETSNMFKVTFYYKPLSDFLFSFGKKEKKHLPDNLFVNNKDYLNGLYDGLLDSDGHYSDSETDKRKSLCNTSGKVIELFNIINFKLFGYMPNNLNRGKAVGKINGKHDAYISRTLARPEWRLTNDFYIVKNLEYKEDDVSMETYDLTVDCDTHSFIANNMIVHNSTCSTRVEAGAGNGQLSALMEVSSYKKEFFSYKDVAFIADGGIRYASDLVKCLAFADLVMAGSLFAGSCDAPCQDIMIDGKLYKNYEGSSTHKDSHVEGVKAVVEPKGPASEIVEKLLQGLKSGCSYQGAHNLTELKENPVFVRVTNAGLIESHPHSVKRIT